MNTWMANPEVTFFKTLDPNGQIVPIAEMSEAYNSVVRESEAKSILLVPMSVAELQEPEEALQADVFILEAPIQNMTAVMVERNPDEYLNTTILLSPDEFERLTTFVQLYGGVVPLRTKWSMDFYFDCELISSDFFFTAQLASIYGLTLIAITIRNCKRNRS